MDAKSAELATLIKNRGGVKRALTRVSKFIFESGEEADKFSLEARNTTFRTLFEKFDSVQSQIEAKSDEDELTTHEVERQKFEDDYHAVEAKFLELFESLKNVDVNLDRTVPSSINTVVRDNFRLPKIELPNFEGNIIEYTSFIETFDSLIHRNSELSGVNKLHYLKSVLKGNALKLIDGLAMTETNYDEARALLRKRYDNKRCIVQAHLRLLFGQEIIKPRSAQSLNKLIDTTNKHLAALRGLGEEVDDWDTILLYHIEEKLDPETRCEFELHYAQNQAVTFNKLMFFLQSRCQAFERAVSLSVRKKDCVSFMSVSETTGTKPTQKCFCCKKEHPIFRCSEFLGMRISDRFQLVKKLGICINCFSNKHFAKDCKSQGCRRCFGKHNSLLHFDKVDSSSNSGECNSSEGKSNIVAGLSCGGFNTSLVLLYTAVVLVRDRVGRLTPCRALIDNGSQSCFVTTDFVRKLNLTPKVSNVGFRGIGLSYGRSGQFVNLDIESRMENFNFSVQALVLNKITENMPQVSLDPAIFKRFSEFHLADPSYFKSDRIDMLLSNSVFVDILKDNSKVIRMGKMCALKTKLGWIIGGDTDSSLNKEPVVASFVMASCDSTNSDLERLWKMDEATEPIVRSADVCEELFCSTLDIDVDGRFLVELPFSSDTFNFSKSSVLALNRFKLLESRFQKDQRFKSLYVEFMNENIRNGFCELAPIKDDDGDLFYLPHHGVFKNTSLTMKLRVVFDASASFRGEQSLNSVLHVGPKEHNDLFHIILQFRSYVIGFVADIEKMFCQIKIKEHHRDFLRFFWRENQNEAIKTFRLTTLPFGLRCSPFIAIKCLKKLSKGFSDLYPEACRLIERNFYVDDLIAGSNNVQEAIKLINEVREVCLKGHFSLRKWMCSDKRILEELDGEAEGEVCHFTLEDHDSKVLGIFWSQRSDCLSFKFKINTDRVWTKRSILSQLAGIFDPFGWLAPVTIVGKLILQELWLHNIGWDDELSTGFQRRWNSIMENFSVLENIRISRYFGDKTESYLCGFSDASIKAYGAVIYLVNQKIELVAAKSRVAPLKTVSLPRLELCGALLCAKLMKCVAETLKIPIEKCFFWTDSSVVLAWLRKPGNHWKTFVANRVTEIHCLVPGGNWNHVVSKENPADILSRGSTPNQLMEHHIWWNGPSFLKDFKFIEQSKEEYETNIEKRKTKLFVCGTVAVVDTFYERISCFDVMIAVHAWVLRFLHNVKSENGDKRRGCMSANEKNLALMHLVKQIQQHHFSGSLERFKRGLPLKKKDSLISLTPFIDDFGLLRVGGRLQNALVAFDVKHPIILPKKDRFVELLIRHEHFKNKHVGPSALIAIIRQKFWIINAKSVVKSVLNKCVVCFRFSPKRTDQLLGSLPETRTEVVRPFFNVGVDFCGPFLARPVKKRGNTTVNVYISLFICFSTKAIHLELVLDLSTDSFIAALRRFIARRGRPSTIYSDNGTNFVGASRCIKEWLRSECLKETIEWKFIPPRSPNFGGLWESHIKSMKTCLIKEMGNSRLTFEEFNTLLVQIEAVLNSRPLCPVSDAKDEKDVLTPGHFLIGTNINGISNKLQNEYGGNLNNRWNYLQDLFCHYWKRWSKEYLSSLNQRSKWMTKKTNVKIGNIGIIVDENTPPFKWPLCIVDKVYPGKDGLIRVIDVKMNGKIYKRPISKFCQLPDFH